jgi:hypothetical protein
MNRALGVSAGAVGHRGALPMQLLTRLALIGELVVVMVPPVR